MNWDAIGVVVAVITLIYMIFIDWHKLFRQVRSKDNSNDENVVLPENHLNENKSDEDISNPTIKILRFLFRLFLLPVDDKGNEDVSDTKPEILRFLLRIFLVPICSVAGVVLFGQYHGYECLGPLILLTMTAAGIYYILKNKN